jgi:hypothetical protein
MQDMDINAYNKNKAYVFLMDTLLTLNIGTTVMNELSNSIKMVTSEQD